MRLSWIYLLGENVRVEMLLSGEYRSFQVEVSEQPSKNAKRVVEGFSGGIIRNWMDKKLQNTPQDPFEFRNPYERLFRFITKAPVNYSKSLKHDETASARIPMLPASNVCSLHGE